jgi:hypothetical protein
LLWEKNTVEWLLIPLNRCYEHGSYLVHMRTPTTTDKILLLLQAYKDY